MSDKAKPYRSRMRKYPRTYLRMLRRDIARKWTRWRVDHGAPIPDVHNGEALDVWTINQIEKANGLPLTEAGDHSVAWWDAIATASNLPTDAQMKAIYGPTYSFPAWPLNAAIDVANARRKATAANPAHAEHGTERSGGRQ